MKLNDILPFLIPVFFIEVGLALTALVHILRYDKYKCGNRVIWIIIVLFIQIIGPIIYFCFGKEDY